MGHVREVQIRILNFSFSGKGGGPLSLFSVKVRISIVNVAIVSHIQFMDIPILELS